MSTKREAPSAPRPNALKNELELTREVADKIPEPLRIRALAERPIEIRGVDPHDLLRPTPKPGKRVMWYRAAGTLPDQPSLHQYLLAYASDFHFLAASMDPHGVSWLQRNMQVASLESFHVVSSPLSYGRMAPLRGG